MQALLLLAVMTAVFVLGWFFVKKLGRLLEHYDQGWGAASLPGQELLRIGLSNPLVSDCIANVVEQYSKIDADISVRIFYGTEEELIKELVVHKLDMAFLPEHIDIPFDVRYNVKRVLLDYTPVIMKYGGLPIEPITQGNIVQNILYRKETKASFVNRFAEYIGGELAVSKPQK